MGRRVSYFPMAGCLKKHPRVPQGQAASACFRAQRSSGQELQPFARRRFPLPFIEGVNHLRAELHRRRDVQQIKTPRRQRLRLAVAQLARPGVQFHSRNRRFDETPGDDLPLKTALRCIALRFAHAPAHDR